MGLKKYEIITVGSDKRVRALRSWQVGDRYVNIGDVGGIVYDEKTLSQDGACWLFRGNFGFPGARIGGDSIVDVREAELSTTGTPNVDILGSSVVVGAPVRFSSDQTAADAVTLTAADFEQGGFGYSNPIGTNWEFWKAVSPNYIRTVKPIFAGGVPTTLKLDVPGYKLNWFTLDRDGDVIATGGDVNSGVDVTTVVPACHSFVFRLTKDPVAATVPADATAAQIKFTGTYETKLVMVDSRLEVNQATSTGVLTIRPGGTYSISSGAKYPDSVIQNSRVVINALSNRGVRFMSDLSNVNAAIDVTTADAQSVGTYRSVNNLVFTGTITGYWDSRVRSLIQAYNCDNMVVSTTNFPGLTAMLSAGAPIKFYSCNLIEGRFYHHAQIANTYKNIDFAKASADLDKTFSTDRTLGSSEVNGMYRAVLNGVLGPLIESYESVKNMVVTQNQKMYNTTIYADAYFNGAFDIQGTNVFGNTVKHDARNTQNVIAVQGGLTLTANKPPMPNNSPNVVSTINPIRINGGNGFTVMLPTGLQARLIFIDARGIYVTASGWLNNVVNVPAANLTAYAAYITFRKDGDTSISVDDVKGVTVTTYNGCKIVNTGATAATIAGNVRVEDNATLTDTSITGTGYFGGNSIAQGLTVEGAAYMKDNAVFAPTISGAPKANVLYMTDNASFTGVFTGSAIRLIMSDNARYTSAVGLNTTGFVTMRDNAYISGSGSVAVLGALVLRDDAAITAGSASVSGDMTLCGKYKQTASKTWTGKRVIDNENAPEYDNNVKTQYDF